MSLSVTSTPRARPLPKGCRCNGFRAICLASPPQRSAEVLKNISLSKPPPWWHFSTAAAKEGLWADPRGVPVLAVPFLPGTSPTPWAALLQWVPRQIHVVVSQGEGESRARLSQGE